MGVAHSQLERRFRVKVASVWFRKPGRFRKQYSQRVPSSLPAFQPWAPCLLASVWGRGEHWRWLAHLERDCSTQQLSRPKPQGLVSYCLVQLSSCTAAGAVWGASWLLREILRLRLASLFAYLFPMSASTIGVLDRAWRQLGSFTKY